jgi:hypothetical protein
LFVRKYEQRRPCQTLERKKVTDVISILRVNDKVPYIFGQQAMQLVFAIPHAHSITGINNPDQSIRLFEIISPVWSKGPLTSDVP